MIMMKYGGTTDRCPELQATYWMNRAGSEHDKVAHNATSMEGAEGCKRKQHQNPHGEKRSPLTKNTLGGANPPALPGDFPPADPPLLISPNMSPRSPLNDAQMILKWSPNDS